MVVVVTLMALLTPPESDTVTVPFIILFLYTSISPNFCAFVAQSIIDWT
ncbi:hypothetical protein SpAn4DRAFT_0723 [Sporomusa ovata]|uniref:Uncharacterized protein n=1 Tax=Sporomusa ovata TaxID=2378 RepID=A0A0U1L3J2_9FIRM|nr:hypothetical protein SpAn4DRAFT_0723 [Sporomusa ovata]